MNSHPFLGAFIVIVIAIIIYRSYRKNKLRELNIDFNFSASESKKAKYMVVDIETTGLITNHCTDFKEIYNFPRIIQIAWLLMDDEDKLINSDSIYLNPGIKIPPEATRINGITDQMIKQMGIKPEIGMNKFNQDAEIAEIIVCHNTDFDILIIEAELYRNKLPVSILNKPLLCTMKVSKDFVKYSTNVKKGKYPKLQELAGFLFHEKTDMHFKNAHNALTDAKVTAKCYIEMKRRSMIIDSTITSPKNRAKRTL